jgi:Fibronectin type III domain
VLLSVRRFVLPVVVSVCVGVVVLVFGCVAAWAVGAPTVTGELAARLGTTSASVEARVDPDGLATSYFVEYGSSAAYGSKTASVGAGVSEEPRSVSVQLTGLTPGASYHFRVVAVNEAGEEAGADASFTTYPAGIGGPPDGRVYEMVTPAENRDADVYEPGNEYYNTLFPFQAAVDGDAVAYVGEPSTGGNGLSGNGLGNQYVARRSAQGGWSQLNVTPPGNLTGQYQGFSSDLSTGFVAAVTHPPFVVTEQPTFSEVPAEENEQYQILYSRNFGGTLFYPLTTAGPHRSKQGFGSWVGGAGQHPVVGFPEFKREVYAGSSADSSHVLFVVNDAMLTGEGRLEKESVEAVERGIISGEENDELYMSVDGVLSLVNVAPDGSLMPGAVFGGELSLGVPPSFSHVISADGSRIFWTSETTKAVYVRENGERTVQVSPGPAEFWTASNDGKFAFYTEAGGLWRFDTGDGSRLEIAGSAGGVQGVVGTNETGEDGAYVYFVSQETLGGANAVGAQPVAGEDNLYVYEANPVQGGGPKTVFVGTLSGADATDWSLGSRERTSNMSPDGHALVFASESNLTGHPYPDEGAGEVYVYDAADGSLDCVSCRPQASGGTLWHSSSETHVFRWVSEDGNHVFFDSEAPLVVQDVDHEEDVYEWERDGTGECRESSGCVYLISNGVEGPSRFIDASTSGNDVFFTTRGRLAPEDGNESVDLYDARVGGVLPVASPVCSGTGCQGPPAQAPIFATPSSVTFSGVGNFPPPTAAPATGVRRTKSLSNRQKLARAIKQCHKLRNRKQRSVCEKRAHKAYGAKTAAVVEKEGK